MNFVFVSLQRINTDRESTSTSLAKELSKNHKVLYVNPPIDRKTYYKTNDKFINEHIALIKNKKTGVIKSTANLSILNTTSLLESINWIPSTKVFSIFNYFNNKKFAREIQQAIIDLNFDSFILINDKDIFRSFYLKELLKPELSVYLDRDYTLGVDYWKKHGTKLEPLLMKKSDLVVCNSHGFVSNALKHNKNSFYIGNGVDLELFEHSTKHDVPNELKSLKKPIIGYVGALGSLRLDLNLIIHAARARPSYAFVLVGDEDDSFKKSSLHAMGNVHFLGKIHKQDIPPYIKHFDVCINPQIVNEITISNFPLKIIEYLALGKPVVAVSTNTMLEVFSGHAYLSTTAEEFINALDNAISEDHPAVQKERILFAKSFRWSKVVEILLGHIKSVKGQI